MVFFRKYLIFTKDRKKYQIIQTRETNYKIIYIQVQFPRKNSSPIPIIDTISISLFLFQSFNVKMVISVFLLLLFFQISQTHRVI